MAAECFRAGRLLGSWQPFVFEKGLVMQSRQRDLTAILNDRMSRSFGCQRTSTHAQPASYINPNFAIGALGGHWAQFL